MSFTQSPRSFSERVEAWRSASWWYFDILWSDDGQLVWRHPADDSTIWKYDDVLSGYTACRRQKATYKAPSTREHFLCHILCADLARGICYFLCWPYTRAHTLLTYCIILICNYCRAKIYSVILTYIQNRRTYRQIWWGTKMCQKKLSCVDGA